MITVTGVAKSHGARTLFSDVSLQVAPGRRIALIGPNGAGKTTLLGIVAGEDRPDEGVVNRAKDTVVGYLRQDVAETAGRSVLAEVIAAASHVTDLEARMRQIEAHLEDVAEGPEAEARLAEYGHIAERFEHLGGYELEARARKVLAGLGFHEDDLAHDVGELSGGWMMRVALARLLLAGADVLLLDEPTNHLDLASVTWLESFLAAYEGAIVLVSHDRDFMNAVCNRVVELDRGAATEYVGDYAAFVEQRALRLEQQAAAAANQQRKVAATEAFIDRFRYKASKARQVQSRIKSLDKLERIDAPGARAKTVRFRFPAPPRSGRTVVTLDGVDKRYGPKTVYEGMDFALERGRKVALVGPNGAGKSTLLKILAGVLPIDGGERVLGHNVAVSYFAQHQVDALHLDKTVLEEMAAAVDTSSVNPRSMLGAFLFSGDAVDKRVGVLSGGEKSRLALARMLAKPVNLLCMDEPTNHLDVGSRDVLEDALDEYPGTVVLITHDRHLIRSVADTIVEVRDGDVTLFDGDFEYYASKTGVDLDGRGSAEGVAVEAAAPAVSAKQEADRKRVEAERRNRVHRETKQVRRSLEKTEKDLGVAEAEVADLTRTLAEPSLYDDPDKVAEVLRQHAAAKDRAGQLTTRWERLYEQVERATAAAG